MFYKKDKNRASFSLKFMNLIVFVPANSKLCISNGQDNVHFYDNLFFFCEVS